MVLHKLMTYKMVVYGLAQYLNSEAVCYVKEVCWI